MTEPRTLLEELIQITSDYLGPSSERFIKRQIDTHIGKSPEDIKPSDLTTLSEWLRVSLAFVTDDQTLLHEYEGRLNRLQENYSRKMSSSGSRA